MCNLTIAGSQSTPQIMADWDKGLMSIQGDSYPENSFEFFDPIIDWIERFFQQTQKPLRLDLRLVYMNTSSGRWCIKRVKGVNCHEVGLLRGVHHGNASNII